SVLYQAADEVFGPCYPFANLSTQITDVNSALSGSGYTLAKNPKELKDLIARQKPAVFHSLEGGFSVEAPENVKTLAGEGLGAIIVANLVFREISASVNALPFMTDTEYDRMFAMPVKGLTELGTKICEEMCRHGIIPDVTHATGTAIYQVFAI